MMMNELFQSNGIEEMALNFAENLRIYLTSKNVNRYSLANRIINIIKCTCILGTGMYKYFFTYQAEALESKYFYVFTKSNYNEPT